MLSHRPLYYYYLLRVVIALLRYVAAGMKPTFANYNEGFELAIYRSIAVPSLASSFVKKQPKTRVTGVRACV